MAQGTVIWRCRKCGNKTTGTCKCPAGKYYAVYTVGTKQRWKAISKSKKEAQRYVSDIVSAINRGTYREIRPKLFSDYASHWLQDVAATRVKPRTLRSYEGLLRLHLIPFFGRKSLQHVDGQIIQSFISNCLHRKALSHRTTNYLIVILKMMFKHAKRMDLVHRDPTEVIEKVRQEKQEMDYFKPHELSLLLKHADEPFKTLLMTAIYTGMRRGELLALQWGDVDWNSNRIHVRRNLVWNHNAMANKRDEKNSRSWYYSSPKSKRSVRAIIMTPKLREALQVHQIQCAVSPDDLLFCTRKGTPIDGDNIVKQQYHPVLERAGLRRIRWHDLRHSYATLLIAKGENIKFIQHQLGHESAKTTLDTYGHLMPESHHGFGEAFDEMLSGTEDLGSESRANGVLTKQAKIPYNTDHQRQMSSAVS